MDIEKYIDEIEEELDGAHGYAKKAKEAKKYSPQHATMYNEMAVQELGHAEKLLQMLKDDASKWSEPHKTAAEMLIPWVEKRVAHHTHEIKEHLKA